MLRLMAPALEGCRIESVQLDSATVGSGESVTGVIRVTPACANLIAQGLIRLEVAGPSILPGVGIGARADMPGIFNFGVRTAQVTAPTDVMLMARLTIPLPLGSLLILSSAMANVRLVPLTVTDVSVSPNPVVGGMEVEVMFRLSAPVPLNEQVVAQVGSTMIPAGLGRGTTFVVPVPTAPVPAGQRLMLPVSLTFRGRMFAAPVPLEVIAGPQPRLPA